MKKYIYMAALLMVAALALTACGDDEPKEKTTATATYNMTFSQDLLDACSILIYYKADNGRNTFDAISNTWWTKSVTSDKFPAEFGVMYKFSTKSDAELVKDKYDLKCELMFKVMTSKGASYTNTVTIIDAPGVAKNKVVSELNKYSGKSTGFRVTERGIVSEANNLKYE